MTRFDDFSYDDLVVLYNALVCAISESNGDTSDEERLYNEIMKVCSRRQNK